MSVNSIGPDGRTDLVRESVADNGAEVTVAGAED
jgi:hypothetical protein